jgi:hydrogenase nickel incorporation protein HypB
MEIKVGEKILSENDRIAMATAELFHQKKVFCINMMSSPGAGKTSILERTIPLLKDKIRVGVLEGDVATHIDAERIEKFDIPVVQITTDTFGGSCHLSAKMIANRINELPLDNLDVVFVENVGNLICPAGFKIGANVDIVVLSLSEGPEKPLKYPAIFQRSDLVLVNKTDIAGFMDIDLDVIRENIRKVNPKIEQIFLSARTGEGFDDWIEWIKSKARQA